MLLAMPPPPRGPNPSRAHLRREVQRFARETREGMLVLDAGAGRSPYRRLFDHARYEASDFAQLDRRYAPLDYVCDITDIPVEDGRFDRVLCNQVLEHVPEPTAAVAELLRVTKPGGRVLCSVPLFFAEHQAPHDYYRYTRYGLRRLFEQAGWEVERLDWLEGYLGTVSYQIGMMGRHLPSARGSVQGGGWRGVRARLLLGLMGRAAPWLAKELARLDVANRHLAGGMPKNYVVVARRPQ
jgi:SAM-dependent methyltransferase